MLSIGFTAIQGIVLFVLLTLIHWNNDLPSGYRHPLGLQITGAWSVRESNAHFYWFIEGHVPVAKLMVRKQNLPRDQ